MTINIQKCSNVTVNGTHSHKNCKAVYCIDTGEMYASCVDAANAEGVTPTSISYALTGKSKTCNGKRFCYLSKMMEHLEEINNANRIRANKVAAYDADIERRNALAKAQEKVDKYKAHVEEFQRRLDEEIALMTEAETELLKLKYNG